ncbi:DUF261 family protein [Borrelia sp. P9F1]|uniref:DUF261 family protein n=1 Tax=Borrelia sp. P9F1 TaxID=3058374 RepID=UPI002647848E|nr:DUF261 family protein [Borrelia sp. P9F1]WKC58577.1 DUF261 family protein [Borrelia sp. P9F1]
MKVRQDDQRLFFKIREWGCYLLSLHYWVFYFKKIVFEYEDINSNYRVFKTRGYINENCYIKDPVGILRQFGVFTTVRYESGGYKCSKEEFEISEIKNRGSSSHFIATRGDMVLYDGLSLGNRRLGYRDVFSKRIFSLQEGGFLV